LGFRFSTFGGSGGFGRKHPDPDSGRRLFLDPSAAEVAEFHSDSSVFSRSQSAGSAISGVPEVLLQALRGLVDGEGILTRLWRRNVSTAFVPLNRLRGG
jgi:hypothetical protein